MAMASVAMPRPLINSLVQEMPIDLVQSGRQELWMAKSTTSRRQDYSTVARSRRANQAGLREVG